MNPKRVTLFAGHYGSGKTNIAVNFALWLRKRYERVLIADLDIVNPYFRTKDSEEILGRAGVRVLSQQFANSNVDLPALPQEMYSITDDKAYHAVADIGGDDRGAYALGRYAPARRREKDFDMLFVANFYRPLTRCAADAYQVMREIEAACGMPFTGIVNNSNIGGETSPEDVLNSLRPAKELCALSGLELRFTSVREDLAPSLSGEIGDIFPIELQKKYYDIKEG